MQKKRAGNHFSCMIAGQTLLGTDMQRVNLEGFYSTRKEIREQLAVLTNSQHENTREREINRRYLEARHNHEKRAAKFRTMNDLYLKFSAAITHQGFK